MQNNATTMYNVYQTHYVVKIAKRLLTQVGEAASYQFCHSKIKQYYLDQGDSAAHIQYEALKYYSSTAEGKYLSELFSQKLEIAHTSGTDTTANSKVESVVQKPPHNTAHDSYDQLTQLAIYSSWERDTSEISQHYETLIEIVGDIEEVLAHSTIIFGSVKTQI